MLDQYRPADIFFINIFLRFPHIFSYGRNTYNESVLLVVRPLKGRVRIF